MTNIAGFNSISTSSVTTTRGRLLDQYAQNVLAGEIGVTTSRWCDSMLWPNFACDGDDTTTNPYGKQWLSLLFYKPCNNQNWQDGGGGSMH